MTAAEAPPAYTATSAWAELVAKAAALRAQADGSCGPLEADDMLALWSALDAAVAAGAPHAVACALVLGPDAEGALTEIDELLSTLVPGICSAIEGTPTTATRQTRRADAKEALATASQAAPTMASLHDLALGMVSPVDASEFEEAFAAGLQDALETASTMTLGSRKRFEGHVAMAAAGAHLIPGGKTAVDKFLARRKGAVDARRFATRVRSLVARLSRAGAPQAALDGRLQRPRGSRRSAGGARQVRAGPAEGPPPDPDPPSARMPGPKRPRLLRVQSTLSPSAVRPWEREILLPFASRLLAALMQGEDDGTTKE